MDKALKTASTAHPMPVLEQLVLATATRAMVELDAHDISVSVMLNVTSVVDLDVAIVLSV